ncbi:ABC transporter C-terminal domain-containing protein [Lentilactobacillus otakiensis]|uniref:ABC transporter C-terminal domain-containing protein n=1 Tax=Lentilactobacillus otakiensis TaxID=481720 RepID=UPI003D16ADFE
MICTKAFHLHKILDATKSKDSIETEMTKPDVFNDLGKLQDLQKQLDSINAQIKETESSWEEQSLKLEDNE